MATTALKKVRAEPVVPVSETAAAMMMIERITSDPSVSIDRLEQAFAFYERVQAKNARKAFDSAMSAAKAEIPVIAKNRTVDFTSQKGKTTYRHEDLAEIARTVDPILAKHGLSYRFRTKMDGAQVVVTCVVSHDEGFFEETSLPASRDDSGNKNNIQALGSAITYLQRYTLKSALGLSASHDDDATSADKTAVVSDAQAETLRTLVMETGSNLDGFLNMANAESIPDILAKDFEGLQTMLKHKLRSRKS